MKRWGLTAIALLFAALVLLSGCAVRSNTSGAAEVGYRSDMAVPEAPAKTAASVAASEYSDNASNSGGLGLAGIGSGYIPDETKKIIRNANITMETREFDDTIQAIESLVNECRGYVENSSMTETGREYIGVDGQSVRYRAASYTLRIPKEQYDHFLAMAAGAGSIVYMNTYIDDITTQYIDTEARLKALRTQEETLLGMMAKATLVEDMITIESKLTEVRYNIESLTSTLRMWQNDVDYSTIQMQITEVSRIKPQTPAVRTLGQRIVDAFKSSIEALIRFGTELLVWLASALPILIILAVIVLITVRIVRSCIKRRRAREVAAPAVPILDQGPKEPKNDE